MVQEWVKDLVEGVMGKPPKIGQKIKVEGRPAIITSGQYWGEHGLSNWWTWKFTDGKKPKTGKGYL